MSFTRRQIFYLAVTVATLTLLGFVAHRGWNAWQNHRIKQWVESYGGYVDWAAPSGIGLRTPKWIRDWVGEPILDDISGVGIGGSPAITFNEIESLTRLRHLSVLGMAVTTFGDDHAKVLSKSRSITELWLFENEVSDDGLAHIAGSMSQLKLLVLNLSEITGEGLSHLRKMPNLKHLGLDMAPITDANLAGLRGTDGLTGLDVGELITDAGISEIVQLKSLERILFTNSSVTDAGIDALIAGLPNLKELDLWNTQVSEEKLAEIEWSGIGLVGSL